MPSKSFASHSYITLQQVLCEAPRLLELIPKESLAIVVAISRGIRKCCHAYVTSITEVPAEDLQLLINEAWPNMLQKLDLCVSTCSEEQDMYALVGSQWPALTCLDLSGLDLTAEMECWRWLLPTYLH